MRIQRLFNKLDDLGIKQCRRWIAKGEDPEKLKRDIRRTGSNQNEKEKRIERLRAGATLGFSGYRLPKTISHSNKIAIPIAAASAGLGYMLPDIIDAIQESRAKKNPKVFERRVDRVRVASGEMTRDQFRDKWGKKRS